MRTDARDRSRFATRVNLPAIDHEANGPLSALVQLAGWVGRLWALRATKARSVLVLDSRR